MGRLLPLLAALTRGSYRLRGAHRSAGSRREVTAAAFDGACGCWWRMGSSGPYSGGLELAGRAPNRPDPAPTRSRLGGSLVIAGLLRLMRGGSVVSTGQGQTTTALANQPAERRTAVGYMYAATAPIFFGLAFVARKWGLQLFPNAVIGAFIGAAAAFVVVVASDAFGRRLRERMQYNVHEVPWLFVWAGVASSAPSWPSFPPFSSRPPGSSGCCREHNPRGRWGWAICSYGKKSTSMPDWLPRSCWL